MKQYELVALLNSEEDQFKAGKQVVADLLAQHKAAENKRRKIWEISRSHIQSRKKHGLTICSIG